MQFGSARSNRVLVAYEPALSALLLRIFGCGRFGVPGTGFGPQKRKQDHVADGMRVREQHCQTIDAYAAASGGGHAIGERANVVLIHLVRFFVAALAFLELGLEATALVLGVVELAEAVGNLHPAGKDLPALSPFGLIGLLLR